MPASQWNFRALFVFVGEHDHDNRVRHSLTCPSSSASGLFMLGVSASGGLRTRYGH